MKKLVLALCLAVAALPAFAGDSSYLKLSLWDQIAVSVPLNNQNVTGLDFGIGSETKHLTGLQFDFIYAHVQREVAGVQWAWIFADAQEVTGWQGALLARADRVTGLHSGLVTLNNREVVGVNWGLANMAQQITGVQLGFVNIAESVSGLQFGLVNKTADIRGLQIGLVNLAGNGWFPVMIIVNGRF